MCEVCTDLSLHLIIQELFAEFEESVLSAVVVEIHGVQDEPATQVVPQKVRQLKQGWVERSKSKRQTHWHSSLKASFKPTHEQDQIENCDLIGYFLHHKN